MTWIPAIPAMLTAAALLFIPGLALGLAIGLRGLWLAALAPLISATMLSVAAVTLPLISQPWSVLWVSLFCVGFSVLVALLFRIALRARFTHFRPIAPRATAAAATLAGAVIAFWGIFGIGDPTGISQTFDNIFHLNILRYIEETQNASTLTVGTLTGGSFYPDGWHVFVSLVQLISGADIPVALNSFNIIAAATIWPLGMLLLVRQLTSSSGLAMLSAGVLSAGFAAFPLNLLFYGVIYPYFFGLLLAPALLSVVLQLLGLTKDELLADKKVLTLLLIGLLPGISLAHPGATMAVLAFSVPAALVACFSNFSTLPRNQKTRRVIYLGIYLVVGLAMLLKLRPDPGGVWGPRMSWLDAAYQSVTLSLLGYGLPLLLAALVAAGVIIALRRRQATDITQVGMWAVAILLFFTSAGLNFWSFRLLLTGVWYGDAPRLAALVPMAAIPLATASILWLLQLKLFRRRGRHWLAGATLVLLFIGTQATAGLTDLAAKLRDSHAYTENAALISDDELTLLHELPTLVPEGSIIIGNPWTGTSLAYAFAGIEVALPHIFVQPDSNQELVLYSLHEARSEPEVCRALKRTGIDYVLDFGDREVHGADHEYPGIEDLPRLGLGTVVAQRGEAQLIRITAC